MAGYAGEKTSMATTTKTNANSESKIEVTSADGPVLDRTADSVKKMVRAAKKRGFVTVDELNSVLPSEQTDPDRIEDVMSTLSEMGINIRKNAIARPYEMMSPRAAPLKQSAITANTIRAMKICLIENFGMMQGDRREENELSMQTAVWVS